MRKPAWISGGLGWEPWAIAAASIAGVAALAWLSARGWPGTPSACVERFVCYCEVPVAARMRQPFNTWTNLASFLVATWIAADASGVRRQRGEGVQTQSAGRLGFAFAATIVAQGLGSMAFHASLTVWGAMADALGMFLVLGFLLVMNVVRSGQVGWQATMLGYAALLAVTLTYRLWVAPTMAPLFALVAAAILVSEWRLLRGQRIPRSLRAALGVFGAAVVAWALSLRPGWPMCRAGLMLQGHGLWHVLAALALALLWIHARTELTERS